MKKFFLGAGLLSLAVSHPAFAASGLALVQPSSGWVEEKTNESCMVRRAFRRDEDHVYLLQFQQYGLNDDFDAMVIGTDVRTFRDDFAFRWSADGPEIEGRVSSSIEMKKYKGFIFSGSLIDPEIDQGSLSSEEITSSQHAAEEKVDGLYLTGGVSPKIALMTGSLRPAFETMRSCIDELLEDWGLDVEAYKARQRGPRTVGFETWSDAFVENYPIGLIASYKRMHNRIRLVIDTDGTIMSCHSQIPIEPKRVAEKSCEGLKKRARFKPALDAQGMPIKGVWHQIISFTVSDDDHRFPGA